MTDREKLIEILSVPIYPRIGADPAEVVADYLMDNDVRPMRHAHWEEVSPYSNCGMKCSQCKSRISYREYYNGNHPYCHKCGAKMDEVTGNAE